MCLYGHKENISYEGVKENMSLFLLKKLKK